MKISNITNQAISFRGSIIDSHVHRGTEHSLWNSKEFPTSSLDEFIKSPMDISVQGTKQTDNVIKVLVSSSDIWSASSVSALSPNSNANTLLNFSLKILSNLLVQFP